MRKSMLLAVILTLIVFTVPFASSRLSGLGKIEKLSPQIDSRPRTFAFYYPWYSTPDGVYGKWGAWNQAGHNPENVTDGKRDIAAEDYPLKDTYDSANETVIEEQIQEAKDAGIEGFIVSWWGINTTTANASMHIRNVCEKNNFLFMFYYEENRTVEDTETDIAYLLNNYANSTAYYKIDGRPVIYVYTRAVTGIGSDSTQYWNFHGWQTNETLGTKPSWLLYEPVRNPPRYGVFPIHPNPDSSGYDGIGYIENGKPVFLQPTDSYVLKAGISDIRNDAPPGNSDVGFRIRITNGTDSKTLLNDTIVNFDGGWQDLSFDVSDYAGQNVTFRVESYAGGSLAWNSEWAAVDYLYIENSEGQIVSPDPFLDNGWKTVVENLTNRGFDPFLSMDFTDYQNQLQNFADYFLNFTDGLHVYSPIVISQLPSQVLKIYTEASNAAHLKNKLFTASVTPGFDNSAQSDQPLVIGRYNGTYYRASWSVAEACSPDSYAVTSFNEWLEGTEIEPSLQYGYQYMNITKNPPTHVWTVDNSNSSGLTSIQETIDAADPGDGIIVSAGTYDEDQINITKSIALIANGTVELDAQGEGSAVQVAAENVAVDGFTIKNVSTGSWGIEAKGASNFLIMGIAMQNNSGLGGIKLDNCEKASLIFNLLVNTSQGGADIKLNASNNILIRDNTCTSTSNGYGIEVENSYNNSICQNRLVENLCGIELKNSSNTCVSTNNVTENSQDGIRLNGCSNNSIVRNDIIYNLNGINLNLSSDNVITENSVLKSNSSGISLNSSSRNNLTNNEVTLNQNGFWMTLSSENLIKNNTIITNTLHGILLDNSTNNTLSENLLSNNNVSLALDSSSYNTISGNTMIANSGGGIFLHSSLNNTMFANNLTSNTYGLTLESSANSNRIFENDLNNNSYAFSLINSSDNQFYHNNFINNTIVEDGTSPNSLNTWDNGYSSGGNYWSSKTGVDQLSGPNQNETGPDWILDSPIVIDQNNLDRYPLEYPFTIETEEIRIAYRSLLVKYDTAQLETQMLNSSLTNLQTEIGSLVQNNSAMQEQLTRTQTTIDNLNQSLGIANQQIGDKQEQINSLNNQVNTLTIIAYVSITLATVLGTSALYLTTKKPKAKPKDVDNRSPDTTYLLDLENISLR